MLTVIAPAATHDLTVLETVKAELEVSGSGDDAFLARLIQQASGDIARYCNRAFALEAVREVFRLIEPYGGEYDAYSLTTAPLLLRRSPVVQVLSIVEDDGAPLQPAEYELEPDTGLIRRLSDSWIIGFWGARVVVEYRAGYELLAGLPHEVERACIDLVKARYFARSRDPALRSEAILDVINASYTSSSSAATKRGLPLDIAERLDAFRRFEL